jgi:2-polyprenyl-3-methyl-5-hydroxy-6-metoxy-1,4-benzoquinol methylase
MLEDKSEDAGVVKDRYNEISKRQDEFYRVFGGRLCTELEWKRLVKNYLPEDKHAKVLDAGGGISGIILPIARVGYQVTLCDLSWHAD